MYSKYILGRYVIYNFKTLNQISCVSVNRKETYHFREADLGGGQHYCNTRYVNFFEIIKRFHLFEHRISHRWIDPDGEWRRRC